MLRLLPLVGCTGTFVPSIDDECFLGPSLLLGITEELRNSLQCFRGLDLAPIRSWCLSRVASQKEAMPSGCLFCRHDLAESLAFGDYFVALLQRLKFELRHANTLNPHKMRLAGVAMFQRNIARYPYPSLSLGKFPEILYCGDGVNNTVRDNVRKKNSDPQPQSAQSAVMTACWLFAAVVQPGGTRIVRPTVPCQARKCRSARNTLVLTSHFLIHGLSQECEQIGDLLQ